MLTEYITAALRRAHYEILPDGEGVYAEIRELPGVWANGDTVEDTGEDLRLALEGEVSELSPRRRHRFDSPHFRRNSRRTTRCCGRTTARSAVPAPTFPPVCRELGDRTPSSDTSRVPCTLSRGSCEPRPYAPSGRARLPTMLLSPLAVAARSGGRPRSHIPPNFSPLRGGSMTG